MSSFSFSPRAGLSPWRLSQRLRCATLGLLSLAVATAAMAQLKTNLSYERIVNSANDPGNWLTYGGNYAGQRYSTLTEITPANVAGLKAVWMYQQGETVGWEVTPLVVDGIM